MGRFLKWVNLRLQSDEGHIGRWVMSHTNPISKARILMSCKGIRQGWFALGAVSALTAAAVGMRIYVVRELLAVLLIFLVLFAVAAIAVAIALTIDEIAIRAFTWLRVHIMSAHFHFRLGASTGTGLAPVHTTRHFS